MSAYARAILRRERWGRDDWDVARRARLFFGTPPPLSWARGRGVRVLKVRAGGARGEWIIPARA
ncbi:MAG TPA: hypothetical protein VIP46_08295, partial [Pyrinomonadaceae bacterium]